MLLKLPARNLRAGVYLQLLVAAQHSMGALALSLQA
ncbi:unnamed protein product, partial [Amoebophrya sp. A25]|eukprot:GSA25T00021791001.1